MEKVQSDEKHSDNKKDQVTDPEKHTEPKKHSPNKAKKVYFKCASPNKSTQDKNNSDKVLQFNK